MSGRPGQAVITADFPVGPFGGKGLDEGLVYNRDRVWVFHSPES